MHILVVLRSRHWPPDTDNNLVPQKKHRPPNRARPRPPPPPPDNLGPVAKKILPRLIVCEEEIMGYFQLSPAAGCARARTRVCYVSALPAAGCARARARVRVCDLCLCVCVFFRLRRAVLGSLVGWLFVYVRACV